MRITNRIVTNGLLLNLTRGLGRLDRLNNQLGSKKQIRVPSDDPVKAGIILRMSSSVRETEQYIRNVDSSISWLDASDVVLKDVLAVIHRAKDLAVRGESTHLDETSKRALADEVGQLHDNLLQLANSTHAGRYLFAGQKTQTEPFTLGSTTPGWLPKVDYNGDNKEIGFEIGVNVTLGVNLDGERLFGDLFSTLRDMHAQLSGAPSAPTGSSLGDLDDALDGVLKQVSELGGKQNRVELAHERLEDLRLNLIKILSEEQDLDYAEAIMELKMEEFAYRTALSVGARIIQPSLVDFLR